MWTHIFFVIAGWVAFQRGLFDLLFVTMIMVPLSLLYHYFYEKPGILTQLEGISAKLLFLYALCQIFFAPSTIIFSLELFFLFVTVFIYVITNIKKDYYDPWHCFMHIIPSFWSIIVSMYHKPLFVF